MKLTIYRKMVTGFVVVICLMIAAHAYTLFELHILSNEAQSTLTLEVQVLDLAKRLRGLLDDEDAHARKYLVTRDRIYYDLFQETAREFQKVLASLVLTEVQRQTLLHRVAERHHSLSRSLPEPSKWGRTSVAFASRINDRARNDHIEFIDRLLKGLIRINQLSIDGSMTTFVQATSRSTFVAGALMLLTILTASLAAWTIARTITQPIRRLVQASQQIGRGFFEPIRVRSHDETALLADAINDMSVKLKGINEAKADLMHQIVHELRNPLQIIFFARNLLAEQEVGNVNTKQLEMLDLIGSNAEKLLSFTNQFLDLAKIDAGMMEYHRAPADLVMIVARAVQEARALASRKDISVKYLSEPVPQTLADGEKLAQVFSNLLSNAVKYTERGGSVAVAIYGFDRKIYVAIKDSGFGIAAEELPNLFTKFYQAGSASKTRAKGTGIGLALVKAFVEGHGGAITVTSTLGIGSTFTVELPVENVQQVESLETAHTV